MFWKRLSIGRKLFLAIVVTVMMTHVFFATAVFWNLRDGLSGYILAAEAQRLSPVATEFSRIYTPDKPGWPEFVGNRTSFNAFVRSSLSRSQPQPGDSSQSGKTQSRGLIYISRRLALLDANGSFIVGADIDQSRAERHPIVKQDGDGSSTILGYLAMASPMLSEQATDLLFAQDQRRTHSITAILAIVLSSLAAFLLSRLFVSPIRDLLNGAKKLSDGSLNTRLTVDRYDEMGELQLQFNNLAETLEANERSERQWISDTSHELQTPLAILRAEIEALQDGVREANDKTLATLHESVIRLSSLVRDIGVLSHAREGVIAGVLIDEDFSELVRDSAERADSLINESGLTLELDVEPDLIVSCDRLRIGQLLDNLLSNSIRYTHKGGRIRLKVFQKRKRVFVHCEDTVPCPPEDSISKLFDRFYRNEKSRSRLSGGSGLGLPICRAIVQAHRGQIHAEQSQLGGLKVVVALPVHNFGRQKSS